MCSVWRDRRLEHLAQLAVCVRGDAAVLERVLVPEEVGLVAGPADRQRLAEVLDLARRIDHQCHVRADRLTNGEHVFDLAPDVLCGQTPSVDLERGVAHLLALDRELGKLLGGGKTAVFVAVQGRGIGR